MANATQTQNQVLETYLRGTGRTLTQAQAQARFGIQNLAARMSEFRKMGLTVRKEIATTTGKTKYAVSKRDILGGRSRVFG